MVLRLNQNDKNFTSEFANLLSMKREISQDVADVVHAIIDDVKMRGDEALVDYTNKFDRQSITQNELRISDDEIKQAIAAVDEKTMAALVTARDRIKSHHERQLPKNDRYQDAIGVELGSRWNAIEAAGLYVPGGTASYPSSVLMNAVPAQVAGVKRIAMVVPTPDGAINPLVLAAANLAGIHEIYRIGGAQAIAALAFGTKTIAPVAKITGPGNAFVAAAKRQVFGTVGIDMIAGPSEVLVVADEGANPDWVAADLLAQAEHDESAQSILITTDETLANSVEEALERQLRQLPREAIARKSWEDYGAIILVKTLEDATSLVDAIAPEHLELAVDEPEPLFDKIHNAGAVFLGHHTPEAVGDYVAGCNHVLPTARSARFSSALSVLDFMKRSSILKCGAQQLREIGEAAMILAEEEGLSAHAKSISLRLN